MICDDRHVGNGTFDRIQIETETWLKFDKIGVKNIQSAKGRTRGGALQRWVKWVAGEVSNKLSSGASQAIIFIPAARALLPAPVAWSPSLFPSPSKSLCNHETRYRDFGGERCSPCLRISPFVWL